MTVSLRLDRNNRSLRHGSTTASRGSAARVAVRSASTLNLMKVPALRIEVNGELVAVAGAPGLSMLSGQVAFGATGRNRVIDTSGIMFNVMGLALNGPQPKQLTWPNGLELKVGDKVTFEIVEASDPTPPGKVLATPSSSELAREAAKQKKGGSQ